MATGWAFGKSCGVGRPTVPDEQRNARENIDRCLGHFLPRRPPSNFDNRGYRGGTLNSTG